MTGRKQQRKAARTDRRERLARHIACTITRAQSRLSGRLNRAFAKMGRRTQVAIFVFVIAAMAVYCTCLILNNLR